MIIGGSVNGFERQPLSTYCVEELGNVWLGLEPITTVGARR
jgi:hypothetical protein